VAASQASCSARLVERLVATTAATATAAMIGSIARLRPA
jgi:hypothetical protein